MLLNNRRLSNWSLNAAQERAEKNEIKNLYAIEKSASDDII